MSNALCIGGPYDGEVFIVEDGRHWFRAVVREPLQLPPTNEPVDPIEYKIVTYVERKLAGISIWAPEVMREQQIIQLLIMRYFSGNAK